ncbi:MAG: 1-deoxy-D-xylulose-5-phosphate reductoisomerase, partial [Varibaculum cambriense]|nr:1-deoxy-D-xylulose-5-phosphate reductoisomerase [Varibaculum cambriense]
YNAANEVFVDAFLDGNLPYLQIVDSLAQVLAEHTGIDNPDLAQIMEAQTWAKSKAQQIVMNAR